MNNNSKHSANALNAKADKIKMLEENLKLVREGLATPCLGGGFLYLEEENELAMLGYKVEEDFYSLSSYLAKIGNEHDDVDYYMTFNGCPVIPQPPRVERQSPKSEEK